MRIIEGRSDFAVSPERALSEIDERWREYDGLLIYGSHDPDEVLEKLDAIHEARTQNVPALLICFGMQLAAVEFSRNVLGLLDANSQEFDPDAQTPVVERMPELRVGIRRVGARWENFWHNYKVADWVIPKLLPFWDIAYDEDNIVASMRLKEHPFFIGTQFHGEYGSSRKDPHPLFLEFITACKKYAQRDI